MARVDGAPSGDDVPVTAPGSPVKATVSLADREGFEPSGRFHARSLSKGVP